MSAVGIISLQRTFNFCKIWIGKEVVVWETKA